MDGWMDGGIMDGWVDAWMNGWMDRCPNLKKFFLSWKNEHEAIISSVDLLKLFLLIISFFLLNVF